jgi:hypothetical protein
MTGLSHAQKLVVIGVVLILGALGVRVLATQSIAPTEEAQKADIDEVYVLAERNDFDRLVPSNVQRIRDIPGCVDELAADRFYRACFDLMQAGPEKDCTALANIPAGVTVPKDFEQAFHLKTQNYQTAPRDCQSHRTVLSGRGFLSGRHVINDQ